MAVFKREARKPRHQTTLQVWLTLDGGFAKRRCTVLDLSVTGARLQVANGNKLGNKIALALTNDVRKLTPCRLIWQKGDQIGVEFVAAA
ncbi:MAG: PilZ domain-containing protein [Xanthobacteraceae bacterium]|nr:PilZ domain-containing protein [Xanthobacteraceae bacterium]